MSQKLIEYLEGEKEGLDKRIKGLVSNREVYEAKYNLECAMVMERISKINAKLKEVNNA